MYRTLIIGLLLIIAISIATTGRAADCHISDYTDDQAVGGDGSNWCWAACIKWCACRYGTCEKQCAIVAFFCTEFKTQPVNCTCCTQSQGCECSDHINEFGSPCTLDSYNGHYISFGMAAMGFDVDFSPGTMRVSDLETQLCSSSDEIYVMAGFSGSPAAGDGHEVVIYGVAGGDCPCFVYYMDPYDGSVQYCLYEEFVTGTFRDYGPWVDCIAVKGYLPPTGIGDIASFQVQLGYGFDVDLNFSIYDTADPSEKAAVYITDNPLGPARLISALVDTVVLLPQENHWLDRVQQWRGLYNSDYYYFLDHDYEPFDSIRTFDSGLRAYYGNPISYSLGYEGRLRFSPPESLMVRDVPCDFGTALELTWALPACDSIVDCYNIYRKDSIETDSGYAYLASVAPGTNYYIDYRVNSDYRYRYLVSAAHHGYYSPPSETPPSCFGIWNDFSGESRGEMTPFQDIAYIDLFLSPGSSQSLKLCPQGDGDTLRVSVQVRGADSTYSHGIPSASMYLLPSYNNAVFCDQDTMFAARDTDSLGISELFYSSISACDSISLLCKLKGMKSDNTLRVAARSPDLTLDKNVNISDLIPFGTSYYKCHDSPGFNPCCDFNYDGCCNLSDLSFFGGHYQHHCPELGYLTKGEQCPLESSSMRIVLDKARDCKTTHKYYATIYITNAKPVVALCLGLSLKVPREFTSFLPQISPSLQVAAAEVNNDGREILFISAWSDVAFKESEIELGTLEIVATDKDIVDVFIKSPFDVVFGDVLGADGKTATIKSSCVENAYEINSEFVNEIGQNYPNPFNPSTIIEYSIATDSHVYVTIYNVNGQRVRTLVDSNQPKNRYRVTWDGRDDRGARVQNGVYFCRINTGSYSKTNKILIVR